MRKINFKRNKKGQSTIYIFLFIFIVFFLGLFLGLALYGFNLVDEVFDRDIAIGQVNLSEINADTFGKMNDAFVDSADTIGVILVLGMALLMIINAYALGDKYPKLFFIVDVLILVFIFITAVYLSQTYDTFINSADIFDLYVDDLPRTSTFVLNLPAIVGTLGALIMIFSYIGIRRDERSPEVGGYRGE
jgi:hypothetical protein